jgi:oligoribonuclease NrnB/cAMP/cGMP phosphodiesterase (DHH superfamily)
MEVRLYAVEMLNGVSVNNLVKMYKNIIMTDVSFNDFSKMKELYKKIENHFCWIDHHAPIIIESEKKGCEDIVGYRDIHRSAILNAYTFFYDPFNLKYKEKNIDIELFRILSSWDSFSFEQEGFDKTYAMCVNLAVTNKFNLDSDSIIEFVWKLIYGGMSDEEYKSTINELYEEGTKYNEILTKKFSDLCRDYGDEWTVGEEKRPALCLFYQGHSSSMVFDSVKDKYKNGIVFKHTKNNNWTISLYNTKTIYDPEFDCGKYMKEHYNGGGHKGAAGCTIDNDKFNELIKNKNI